MQKAKWCSDLLAGERRFLPLKKDHAVQILFFEVIKILRVIENYVSWIRTNNIYETKIRLITSLDVIGDTTLFY